MQNIKLGNVYQSGHLIKEQEFRRLKNVYKSQDKKFEDWEFPPGTDALGELEYLESNPDAQIIWKRPHELVREWDKDLCAKPLFFGANGVCRFDINQGGLGDCWFLASLAQLTCEKNLFRVVVPDDNSCGFDDGEYSGAFHFRYWRAGVWTEVVIDDRLPCVKDSEGVSQLIFSKVKNNEFWPVLAEKAFAKLYGSYEQIEGGFPSESLEDLCGGISLSFSWDEQDQDETAEELKDVLRKAYTRKSFIGLGSRPDGRPEEDEGQEETKEKNADDDESKEEKKPVIRSEGIVEGHAYTVTAIQELEDNVGNSHFLIRLRNPWGSYEWKGKWSDIDDESWASVPKDLRSRGILDAEILGGGCDEGEFWINLEDVVRKFDMVDICHWSPLAYEGRLDNINHVSWDLKMLKGIWNNTEKVNPFQNKENLVKFPAVTVKLSRSPSGSDPLLEEADSPECTMAVALIYELYNRSGPDETMPNLGFRVFRVPDDHGTHPYEKEFFETATEITEEIPKSHHAREINKFFKLEEGTYCVVPIINLQTPDGVNDPVDLPFLLRIFSERKILAN